MKLSTPFFEVCDVPGEMVARFLASIEESDWHKSNYRKFVGSMEATDSIPIHHTPLCASGLCNDEPIESIRKEALFDKFEPVLSPFLELLRGYYKFDQYAAFIARLRPRSEIGMHKDTGNFLTKCHRVHVPLQTNPQVAYCIDGAEYHWPVGKAYEFDNTRVHGVKNRSDEMRVHLVINLYNLGTQ